MRIASVLNHQGNINKSDIIAIAQCQFQEKYILYLWKCLGYNVHGKDYGNFNDVMTYKGGLRNLWYSENLYAWNVKYMDLGI